jgi:hypothetical protein
VRPHVDSLDQKLHDTCLLGREEFVPQRVELEQRLPHLILGDIIEIEQATMQLTRRLAQAAQGTGPAVEALQRLNLTADELRRLPLDQRIAAIQDALAAYVPEAQRAAVASKLFGDRAALVFSRIDSGTSARRPRTCATSASPSRTRTRGRSSAPTTRCLGSG